MRRQVSLVVEMGGSRDQGVETGPTSPPVSCVLQ